MRASWNCAFRHTEGRCHLEIDLPRLGEVRLYRRLRDTLTIITGERQKRIDEEAGVFRAGLDALVGDLGIDLEGFEVVLDDAVTGGIHVCERPARSGMAFFGSVAIGFDGLLLLAFLVGVEAELEEVEGPDSLLTPALMSKACAEGLSDSRNAVAVRSRAEDFQSLMRMVASFFQDMTDIRAPAPPPWPDQMRPV